MLSEYSESIQAIQGSVIFVNENENENYQNEKITIPLTKTKTKTKKIENDWKLKWKKICN